MLVNWTGICATEAKGTVSYHSLCNLNWKPLDKNLLRFLWILQYFWMHENESPHCHEKVISICSIYANKRSLISSHQLPNCGILTPIWCIPGVPLKHVLVRTQAPWPYLIVKTEYDFTCFDPHCLIRDSMPFPLNNVKTYCLFLRDASFTEFRSFFFKLPLLSLCVEV
jgi:hypothetical protein